MQARQQAGGILIGPEVTKWFPGGRVLFPRAATLGRLARGRTDFVPGERTGADLPARNPIRQSPPAANRAVLSLPADAKRDAPEQVISVRQAGI